MATGGTKLGVFATTLAQEPREAARLARQTGAAGVLLDAVSGALNLMELSGSGRRELRHALSSQDQQLIGLRVDIGPKGLGPGADVDRVLSRLDKITEAAAALQAPLVCVNLGPLPNPPAASQPKPPPPKPAQAGLILLPDAAAMEMVGAAQQPPPPPSDPQFIAQVDAAMVELGRIADRYSVLLAFRSELAGFEAMERALKQADCPWFGVDLDPVSILRDHLPVQAVFDRIGPLVRHVRGRDALAGADRRTQPAPVGHGSTDWPQLLALLDEADYNGWISVDATELSNRPAAARAAIEFLRTIH